jgi:CubicO group peptidase (beta-lactamase class C family)
MPVRNKSIFRLYSTTKIIITIGVFLLIEEDKLLLKDKKVTLPETIILTHPEMPL